MTRRVRLAVLAIAGAICAVAFAPAATTFAAQTPRVYTSVAPQADLLRRVAGDAARVDVIIPPGRSPHGYDPPPRDLTRIADADMIFRLGMPFERAIVRRISESMPALRIVDAPAVPGADTDPHVWLDPAFAEKFIALAAEELSRLVPERSADFALRRDAAIADLRRLDADLQARLAPYRGREFFVGHAAFGHFARRYGLRQVSLDREGHEPEARHIASFIDRARAAKARVIFHQPQEPRKNVDVVAREIGARVESLDTLFDDYIAGMNAIADAIEKALAE
ncbi:zinc ABC transporter substrate-binding protein [bacterium]|nr:zinc ABC transporter substrate-binding protein [bacterium]